MVRTTVVRTTDASELRDVDPLAVGPALEAEFGELDAFGAVEEGPAEGFVEGDVAEEEFPLDLEGVVVGFLLGDFGPAIEEGDGLGDVGVPGGAGGVAVVLGPAFAQGAGDGAAVGAVDLEGEQVVAADADGPRGVEVGDDAAVELEGGVGGIVGRCTCRSCRPRRRARGCGWRRGRRRPSLRRTNYRGRSASGKACRR